jgi:membrane-associated protein
MHAASTNWLDAQSIVATLGGFAVIGVMIVIFLETSTIFGSFLPGDSLLFILGLSLATSLSQFPIFVAIPLVWIAAVAGSQVGYHLGVKIGPALFKRKDGFFFNQGMVARATAFFEHYGPRAIILARFVPVLRALVPMFVGITHFGARRYLRYNMLGATAWVVVLMLAGFSLGQIDWVKHNIELFTLGFVVLSSLPFPLELLRNWLRQRRARAAQQRD